jgi:hypothetical protein
MRSRLPLLVAIGASLGVIGAYLLAGGASYQPLEVADPCEPRPTELLEQRGVLEGIVFSGLDGAACELGVTREELTLAFADDEALAAFSARHSVEEQQVTDAVRAGLMRATDDAEAEGALDALPATLARGAIQVAPIGPLLSAFRSIPGDPTVPEIAAALRDADITLDGIEGALGEFGSDLGERFDALRGLLDPAPAGGPLDPAELRRRLEAALGQFEALGLP